VSYEHEIHTTFKRGFGADDSTILSHNLRTISMVQRVLEDGFVAGAQLYELGGAADLDATDASLVSVQMHLYASRDEGDPSRPGELEDIHARHFGVFISWMRELGVVLPTDITFAFRQTWLSLPNLGFESSHRGVTARLILRDTNAERLANSLRLVSELLDYKDAPYELLMSGNISRGLDHHGFLSAEDIAALHLVPVRASTYCNRQRASPFGVSTLRLETDLTGTHTGGYNWHSRPMLMPEVLATRLPDSWLRPGRLET
jgi:hypothetical protein